MPAVSFGLPLLPPLSHSFPGFLPEESNLQRLSQHRQRICGKPTTFPPRLRSMDPALRCARGRPNGIRVRQVACTTIAVVR